jgi:hypothetical protein
VSNSLTLWFWLSFADGTRPTGSQWLGAIISRGEDFLAAVRATHAAKINPGGEVQGVEMDDDTVSKVPDSYRNRLLSKSDIDELEAIWSARRDCQGTA